MRSLSFSSNRTSASTALSLKFGLVLAESEALLAKTQRPWSYTRSSKRMIVEIGKGVQQGLPYPSSAQGRGPAVPRLARSETEGGGPRHSVPAL